MAQSFNETELVARVDGDLEFLTETVQMLDADGRALLADVGQALAAGDALAVGRAAHALKGMISNFCAPEAQQSALEDERIGKGGDLAPAPAAVAALDRKSVVEGTCVEFDCGSPLVTDDKKYQYDEVLDWITEAVAPIGQEYQARIFFFQAADGIRVVAVTGVQTCALPI